ncbi:hypothetical protein DEO72_LG8g2257 [Vigna unguiculata]|uniref:Uncharacterized protein n=1 Tax=Vigna unguiculata TaxID=3917 RepID=A0A4D6MS68_VIGUN|nr:hypothetical protein DEO72_LG8g2257 [Vigna unguiculata]
MDSMKEMHFALVSGRRQQHHVGAMEATGREEKQMGLSCDNGGNNKRREKIGGGGRESCRSGAVDQRRAGRQWINIGSTLQIGRAVVVVVSHDSCGV